MDGQYITLESPQEDEFALLAMGVPSVYRAFFDPRRLTEIEMWLDSQAWANLPAEIWWPQWRRFLTSVQGTQDKNLLLKSPNHTFRAKTILGHLPESNLVWMLRDPREVFFSNVKMWKAMFHRYALWNIDETTLNTKLNHFLGEALRFSTHALVEIVSNLPRNQLAVVRFDDLVTAPSQVLESIHERLGISWHGTDQTALRQVIAAANSLPRTLYSSQALPSVAQVHLAWVTEMYEVAFESHGVKIC